MNASASEKRTDAVGQVELASVELGLRLMKPFLKPPLAPLWLSHCCSDLVRSMLWRLRGVLGVQNESLFKPRGLLRIPRVCSSTRCLGVVWAWHYLVMCTSIRELSVGVLQQTSERHFESLTKVSATNVYDCRSSIFIAACAPVYTVCLEAQLQITDS